MHNPHYTHLISDGDYFMLISSSKSVRYIFMKTHIRNNLLDPTFLVYFLSFYCPTLWGGGDPPIMWAMTCPKMTLHMRVF
jgi:hypothetical protein